MIEQQDIFACLERENNNSEIHPQIFELLEKQYRKLTQTVKTDVQLLLGKNKIAANEIFRDLANELTSLLVSYGEQVDSRQLLEIVLQNLQAIYQTESEKLFQSEYKIIKEMNEILEGKMKYILGMCLYQDCMLELEELVTQYQTGINAKSYHIDMEKKISGLTYVLSRTYHLHRDMKLYMAVNHVVENYKNKLNDNLGNKLETLQADHSNYIIKVKDELCYHLQEYQFSQYEYLEKEYSDIENPKKFL